MKTCYIYTLSDPRNNQVRYVGKTNNPKQRRSAHGVLTREQKSRKKNWVKHLKSLSLKPVFEIIEEVSIDEWKEAEKFWITQFKAWGFILLNHTSGGDGLTFGNSTSFKKGQVSWNKGKAFKKICLECGNEYNISPCRAEKSVGCSRKCSVLYRKKNKLFKGVFKKNHTTWNKNKSGYNLGGKKKARPVLQFTKDGAFVKEYNSYSAAAEEINCCAETIRKACIGNIKISNNHIFKYK